MLGRMVGSLQENVVYKGGFYKDGYLYIIFSFVYRDVNNSNHL